METLLRKANATIDSALSAEDKASLKKDLCANFKYLLRKASKIDAPNVIPAIIIAYSIDVVCTCHSALVRKGVQAFNEKVTTALMNATIISTIGHTKGILIESYVKIMASNILSPYINIVHNYLEPNKQSCRSKFISDVRNIFESGDIDEVYNRIQNVIKQAALLHANVSNKDFAVRIIQ